MEDFADLGQELVDQAVLINFLPSLEVLLAFFYLVLNKCSKNRFGHVLDACYFDIRLWDIELLSLSWRKGFESSKWRFAIMGISFTFSSESLKVGFHKACFPLIIMISVGHLLVGWFPIIIDTVISAYSSGPYIFSATFVAFGLLVESFTAITLRVINWDFPIKNGEIKMDKLQLIRTSAAIFIIAGCFLPYQYAIWLSVFISFSIAKVIVSAKSVLGYTLPFVNFSFKALSFEPSKYVLEKDHLVIVSASFALSSKHHIVCVHDNDVQKNEFSRVFHYHQNV
jgi:hypothetical protein